MEMRSFFSGQSPAAGKTPRQAHEHTNSSYSSSLSTGSPESSSLVCSNNPTTTTTSYIIPEAMSEIELALRPLIPESEHEEMTRAILAVLSSSSPNQHHQDPLPSQTSSYPQNPIATIFKKYSNSPSPSQSQNNLVRPSTFKRSISYYRDLNLARIQERTQANRPSTSQTQLQHMISERRRRKKQNDNFQALRSLLPPGSKRDKASVLKSTREYLRSLRDRVAELSQRNQFLEARLKDRSSNIDHGEEDESSNEERVDVRIRRIHETTSSQQGPSMELLVTVRGECTAVDLVIRILEFLKLEVNNLITLASVEANRRKTNSASVNRLSLTLQIQGSEWDESAFQEAVKRVILQ